MLYPQIKVVKSKNNINKTIKYDDRINVIDHLDSKNIKIPF